MKRSDDRIHNEHGRVCRWARWPSSSPARSGCDLGYAWKAQVGRRQARREKLRAGIASRSHGVGTRQIVLAWLLNTSPQILIPGSGSPDHVAENIAAASVQLTSLPMTPPGPWVVIPHIL